MSEVILAIIGSRSVDPGIEEITAALHDKLGLNPEQVSRVVSGKARGADVAGEIWAERWCLPVDDEPITAEDVAKWGKYLAPKARNARIAERATHCLAFWDGQSNGTTDCVVRFVLRGKPVAVVPTKSTRRMRPRR
jgi:hypothetical protein